MPLNSDSIISVRVKQMTAQGRALKEGESLHLDDLSENPIMPFGLWLAGLLPGDGGRKHACADAQARGLSIEKFKRR